MQATVGKNPEEAFTNTRKTEFGFYEIISFFKKITRSYSLTNYFETLKKWIALKR